MTGSLAWVVLQYGGGDLGCYANNPLGMLGECTLPQLVSASGGPALFGVLLSAGLFGSLAVAGNDIAPVAVLMTLAGGVAIPLLPQPYSSFAFSVLVISLTLALMGLANRYILSGAAS